MPNSIKISDTEIRKLKAYLVDKGFKSLSPHQNESLRIKTGDLFLVLYTSGTLVYEDNKSSSEILDHVLEKRGGAKYYIGTDETGKGEWFGPLVVVGTLMSSDQIKDLRKLGIKDSKLLSIDQINRMSGEMLKMSIDRISRVVSPEKYNKLFEELSKEGKNSNDILAWAHSEVVKDLIEKAGTNDVQIIIDKFDFNKTDSRLSSKERVRSVDQTKIKVIQKSKGESEIPVAAASIIAKSIFEEEVQKLSNKYGVDLKSIPPNDLPRDIIPKVAKTNFKNIKAVLS